MTTKKGVLPYLALTLLCLLCYLPGLFNMPIFDQDSAHFAQASRQMLETKNYARINFQTKPRHLKPPGIYWLQAASVKVFSHVGTKKAWPYRIPSMFGGLLSVLALFALSRRLVGDRVAFIGSALIASSVLLIIESRLVVTDAMLLFTMVLMQCGLWRVYALVRQDEPVGWKWPLLFWVGMAAGILIKGITPLVGFLTIMGLCVFDRKIKWIKELKPIRGLLLVLLLTLAWLIPVSVATHSNFLMDMIGKDALPKIASGQELHGMPPGYFIILLTAMFWPGSVFLGHAVVEGWQTRKAVNTRFLLAWILPTWICFELIATKLPEYVLPTYPAIALLCALAIVNF